MIPAPRESVRPGVPETRRITATTITIAIAVPRSGSARTSAQKQQRSIPMGRQRSFTVCGARRRERYDATQIASATLASSEG